MWPEKMFHLKSNWKCNEKGYRKFEENRWGATFDQKNQKKNSSASVNLHFGSSDFNQNRKWRDNRAKTK